ncbi:MAG TPA: sigma 54-interacting transcriptional regulator [Desulfobacteraceae bacterium]|nr:sigma 54-interacting transcriptional regulator [Desulfobacteraceae bacterium]HPJ67162.1 sigma 54-interacting transcriptional regulator [Desulfobacteraceae bacterium]HPQ29332.1 sigma 54-interacting transcriptional regulator [Desulfobacteraceae bacterium]
MNPFSFILAHKNQHLLAYRVLVYILLCSSFFALFSSAIQLYFFYRTDLRPVENNIEFIKENYIPDIAESIYLNDDKQLKILLLAALQLKNIEYIDITSIKNSNEFLALEGNPNVHEGISQQFPVKHHTASGEIIPLGTIKITASVEGVYKRFWERSVVLLLTNTVKTFFASFCILLILQLMLTRHLGRFVNFARSLNLDKLHENLVINRKKLRQGKPDELDQVVIAFNDMIGRIKNDVNAIKQAEEKIRKSEEQYRKLVETMNDSLAVIDKDGLVCYVNDRFIELLGYEKDELMGRGLIEFFDDPSKNIFKEQFGLRKKSEKKGFYEASFISKTLKKIHTIVSSMRITDGDGNFKGSFAVITDITRRKKMELELQTAFSNIKQLKERLEVENIYLREEIELKYKHEGIVGKSDRLKSVLRQVEQVAETDSTVLLMGETGTGKELIARMIHNLSQRKSMTMVKVNCAALPPTLIESELFGREKGAYTGSLSKQKGRFEIADGSTIFLDEVGELPLELQGKLLRVLQEGEFQRLGSSKTICVDVRVIAATNHDIRSAVSEGKFREDLYYRLNVFPIFVPSLRERLEDIPMLVRTFIREFEEKMGKRIETIRQKSMKSLQSYHWPGNIRELRNVIEHAMIISKGGVLNVQIPKTHSPIIEHIDLRLDSVERNHIIKILEKTGWRIKGKNGAAQILGLNPSTMHSKMKKLGVRPNDKSDDISSDGRYVDL